MSIHFHILYTINMVTTDLIQMKPEPPNSSKNSWFQGNSSSHGANSIWNFTFTLRTPFPQVISCTLGCNECPGAQGMKAFGWRDPPGSTHHFWLNATPLTNTLISKERRVIQFKHVHALLVQHLNGIIFLRSFSELALVIINTYIFQEGLKESSSLDTSEAQVEFLVLLYESDQQVKGLNAYSEWSDRLCSKRKVVANRKWGGWRNQVSCRLLGLNVWSYREVSNEVLVHV